MAHIRPFLAAAILLAALSTSAGAQNNSDPAPGSAAEAMRSRIDTSSVAEATPMQSTDARTRAEERLAEVSGGKQGRIIVGRSREALQALAYGEAIDAYLVKTAPRRDEALTAAAAGADFAGDPAQVRSALDKDLAAWRTAFKLDRAVWQDQRDQWLADNPLLSPADWAKRRADWFAARDLWIGEQKAMVAKMVAGDN